MTSSPSRRVVVIGASNVARSGSVVTTGARTIFREPLDLLLAAGHGRAWGIRSWVLGRELPPLLECGIWPALEQRPALPTVAVLTDVGNDLVFGAKPEAIARWIEQGLERLRPQTERLVMTRLPIARVERLSPRAFVAFRTMLFPSSKLTFEDALQGARELDQRVVEMAARHDVVVIEPELEWYGLDPIHVLRAHQKQLWKKIFFALSGASKDDLEFTRSLREEVLLRARIPHTRKLFGVRQTSDQPSIRLGDGTLVSLY